LANNAWTPGRGRDPRPGSATSTTARGARDVLLFARRSRTEAGRTAAYTFLGPVDYVSHRGERPMGITWRLRRPMPADFFREAGVAAG
jgi:hypothetical protein